MKNKWLIPAIILGTLGLIYYMGSLTGMLSTYTIPVTSNEPNVKLKSRIWVSNLAKPQRFDFIIYKMEKGEYWEGGTWLMRLCGLPGDKIQIINGTLFVNGHDADVGLNLKKDFYISKKEIKKLGPDYFKDHPDDIRELENDSVYVSMETNIYRNKSLSGHLIIEDEPNEGIQKIYDKPWNRDNFGPITVPPEKFFVMGDNRHGAADSRYTGFIDQKKYVGTVILIK